MLKLRQPNEEEFKYWFEKSSATQAEDRAFANNTEARDERRRLDQEVKSLLPKGQKTDMQFFYVADNDQENIGFIWMGVLPGLSKNEIFLYDIIIRQEQRRKGYGRELLSLMESKVKDSGYQAVYLNVLQKNHAKQLYLSMGYRIVKESKVFALMIKQL